MTATQNGLTPYFLIGLVTLFFVLSVLLFIGFLAPLVLGAILAAISHGVYHRVLRSLNGRATLAALFTTFLVLLIIIIPLISLGTLVLTEAVTLLGQIQDFFPELARYTEAPIVRSVATTLNIDVTELAENYLVPSVSFLGNYISGQLGALFSNTLNLLIGFAIMGICTFYFLRDGERFSEFAIKVSPLKTRDELFLFKTFHTVGRSVIVGNIISGALQGIIGGIGFALFGLPNAILWGTVMGFLGLIPILGPYLVFLPAAIVVLVSGTPVTATIFLLYNVILVSGIDNVVKPKLIGTKTKIHPLIMLLAILGGLRVFGIIGVLYGPLIIAFFFALLQMYRRQTTAQ